MSKKQREKEIKALKELEKRRKKAGFKIVAVKVKRLGQNLPLR